MVSDYNDHEGFWLSARPLKRSKVGVPNSSIPLVERSADALKRSKVGVSNSSPNSSHLSDMLYNGRLLKFPVFELFQGILVAETNGFVHLLPVEHGDMI